MQINEVFFKPLKNNANYIVCSDGFVIGPTGTILKPFKSNPYGRQYYVHIVDKAVNLATLVQTHFPTKEVHKDHTNALHLDWNELNNQYINLDGCTRGELKRYQNIGKKRGIYQWKGSKNLKWRVVDTKFKPKTLGYFKTYEEAESCYKEYFTKTYGYSPF